MRFLLAGKKPRYRRQESPRSKQWVELENEDGLESDYQHLLWVLGERFGTIEEARLAEFDWLTVFGVGYDDLSGWIAQGVTLGDTKLLRSLARAGISSRHTAQWWVSNPRESVTIMQALLSRWLTIEEVVALIRPTASKRTSPG